MSNIQAATPVANIKNLLNNKGMQELFTNSLKENAGSFMTSIIDTYSSDDYLMQCDPKDVIMVALKAATLKLPINKELGFSYIVAYKDNKTKKFNPQMQIGYKGYIQLAMRTGQYKNLNANVIYEGMEIEEDYLTGEVKIKGKPKNNVVIGYFSYFKLLNGFEKINYMTKDEIIAHAKKFSKTYPNGAWKDNFDAMAMKTVTRLLISKYGPMSTDMQQAEMLEEDNIVREEITINANSKQLEAPTIIDTDDNIVEVVDPETGEVTTINIDEEAPF